MKQSYRRLSPVLALACACFTFSLPSLAEAGLTAGELPSGTTLTYGFEVLIGGQTYTLAQSYSGLGTVTIGGRYSTSLSESGLDGNTFIMSGSTYGLTFTGVNASFYVGSNGGDNNTAYLRNGAGLSLVCIEVGMEGANNNKLGIHGSGTTVTTDYIDVGYSTSGASTGNRMVIGGGAKVTSSDSSYDSTIGYASGSNNNSVVVYGSGSVWKIGYNSTAGDSLAIGNSSIGNTLSIECGGLVILGDSAGSGLTIAANNFVQLADGLLAIGGDVDIATLLSGKLTIWDGSSYVSASVSEISYAYCTTLAEVNTFLTANSLTGYGYDASSLVNYTLVTGGLANVPEPADFAFVGALGAMGLVLLRRKRGASGRLD